MKNTIDEYLRLSIKDCKRLGFLRPEAFQSGVIRWTVGENERAATGFATDTRGVPVARFSYTCDGRPMNETIYLRWKRSNLNGNHGYYYFVCPVTGNLCRTLYLVGGRFVSRKAFKPLYRQQAKSQRERRDPVLSYLTAAKLFEDLTNQRHRREFYNGRITPYGRRVEKAARRVGSFASVFKDLPTD